jgi:hypothetical protein
MKFNATNLPVFLCAVSLSLSACSITPTADGGYQVSTKSLNDLIQNASAPSNTLTMAPATEEDAKASSSAAITYTGPLEGGPGSATLTATGASRYRVHLYVASSAGVGDVTGYAVRNGNILIMMTGMSGPGSSVSACNVQMTISGDQLQVREKDCSAFHGDSVSFNGTLNRSW